MSNQSIKVGCEVFLIKDGALLLGKRKNCYGEGTWDCQVVILEQGESIHECVKKN